jgi:hypothetical protein
MTCPNRIDLVAAYNVIDNGVSYLIIITARTCAGFDKAARMALALDSTKATSQQFPEQEVSDRAVFGLVAIALLLPWAILFASVPPAEQNFPINDDWAFAKGAVDFAEGKGINYQGWASMPLLGQWLWAYPFLQAFGTSQAHVVLRISTIILSWLCLLAFYDLLRQEGGFSPRLSAFVTLVLGLSPYFFWLSGTYMTDIPALTFSLIPLAFFARAYRSGRTELLLAGAAVAVLGALTRQSTVIVPIAAGIVLALRPELRRKILWWIILAIPLIVCVAAHLWVQSRPDTVPRDLSWPVALQVALFPFIILHFVGIAALPVFALGIGRRSWTAFAIGLLLMLASAAYIYHRFPDYMDPANPKKGVLFPYPVIWFPESYFIHGYRPLILESERTRWILTLLGCFGGAEIFARADWFIRQWKPPGLLLAFTAAHLPLLLASPVLYDRYQLVLIPGGLLIAATALGNRRPEWVPATFVLAISAVLTVAVQHDKLEWNRARWKLGQTALASGIKSSWIEGGLEWDGWYSPGPSRWEPTKNPSAIRRIHLQGMAMPFTMTAFPHLIAHYALSPSMIPGTKVVRIKDKIEPVPYRLWLFPEERKFYLLEWQPGYLEYQRMVFGPPAE